ncbi:Very short patch repair protein [bioreactor metagenome]|uniref:Very short patch repair protein n=1 Tax=bioreactor metagenome TaxID=1076179 RepID=A0A645GY94_9ZZZZ
MADIVDPVTRSRIMASIRGKNTKPELKVRRGLHRLGVRFRLHRRDLPGCPDIVFPKYRTVLFVHGCFWHRHEACRFAYTPSTNRQEWIKKFDANVERDRRQVALLRQAGWRVFVIWECALKGSDLSDLLVTVAEELKLGKCLYQEWPKFQDEISAPA